MTMHFHSKNNSDKSSHSSARPFFRKAKASESDTEAFFNPSSSPETSFLQTKTTNDQTEKKIDRQIAEETVAEKETLEEESIQARADKEITVVSHEGSTDSSKVDTKKNETTNQQPAIHTSQNILLAQSTVTQTENTRSTTHSTSRPVIQRTAEIEQDESLTEEVEEQEPIQAKLTIGQPNDPYEQEADAVADRVVQRMQSGMVTETSQAAVQKQQSDESDEEEESLQMKSAGSTIASSDIDSRLSKAGGAGSYLPNNTRYSMETAFGVSFSDVRIHNNSSAQQLNRELNARAFTHKTDIFFNAGEYQPESTEGQRLLAHELTHVVQQNPGLKRKPLTDNEDSSGIHKTSANRLMKSGKKTGLGESEGVFGPKNRMPSGTIIHNNVLPLFVNSKGNPHLFIEAPIPGSNKKDPETGKRGIADLYIGKAVNRSDRTIGINMGVDGNPVYLPKGKLEYGGKSYSHQSDSAPLWHTRSKKIKNLELAPETIEIGDLKPGHSAEEYLGQDQINNYSKGITNTSSQVNNFLKMASSTPSVIPTWTVNVIPMAASSIKIPKKVTSSSSSGYSFSPLSIYRYGSTGWQKMVRTSGLSGSMVVYKSKVGGIWSYEWIPSDIPQSIGHDKTDKVLGRLNKDVIPIIKSKGGKKLDRKPSKTVALSKKIKHKTTNRPNLQTNKFPASQWRRTFGRWKKGAKKFFSSKEGALLSTLSGVNKRTGGNKLKLPSTVKKSVKKVAKIHHWLKFGSMYAWLKKTFGSVFNKISKFVKRVRKKVRGLSRKLGGTSFGSWIMAAAKALFKVFKLVGAWAVNQVTAKLMVSLQTGLSNIINKLVEDSTPEGVKSKIEEVHKLKSDFKKLLDNKQEELEKKIFGDKLEIFKDLGKIMDVVKTVSTIVSVVKWGIRIIACASPPLLGCLWNLVIAALQYAFAKLLQTCWFSKKIFKWIKDFDIKTILKFPNTLAKHVATSANNLIPMPKGLPPLFAKIPEQSNNFQISCGGGGGGSGGTPITPQQQVILDFVQEVGDKKFKALLEVLLKHGAGPMVELTADRINKIRGPLKKLKTEDLKKMLESPVGGKATPLEQFLNEIKKHTPAEKKRIGTRKLDYEKAIKNNKNSKKSLGWKPDLFVPQETNVDSKEFVDAVYDIQKMIGTKADGIVGPNTVVKFYQKNRLGKGRAYKKAYRKVQERKNIRRAKRYYSQLIKDLESVSWDRILPGKYSIEVIKSRMLLYGKTENGARVGAHFERKRVMHRNKAVWKIVRIWPFTNLDPISGPDSVGHMSIGIKSQQTLHFGASLIGKYEKHSSLNLSNSFIGLLYK